MYPPFADMRVIQGAVRSVEHGYDRALPMWAIRRPHARRRRNLCWHIQSNWDYRLIFLIFCIPFLQQRPFPCGRAVILVMLPAMNETLLINWFGVTGLIVAQLAKTVIFAVLSAYLLALAGVPSRRFTPNLSRPRLRRTETLRIGALLRKCRRASNRITVVFSRPFG
jgi:hypothetical protein